MNFTKTALMSILAVAAGCSSSGSKGTDTNPPPPATPIATTAQAASASAAAEQSVGVALSSASYLGGFSEGVTPFAPRFKSMAAQDPRFSAFRAAQSKLMASPKARLADGLRKAKSFATSRATVAYDETQYCYDSGSVHFVGSLDDMAGSYSFTVTFDHCREYEQDTNGVVVETISAGALESFSVRFGDGDGTLEATDFTVTDYDYTTGYADVIDTETMDLTLSGSWRCANEACSSTTSSLTANGKESYVGYGFELTSAYSHFGMSDTLTYTDVGSREAFTANGAASETMTDDTGTYGQALTFYGLVATQEDTGMNYVDDTIDGTVVFDFTPDDACYEGAFAIDTQTPVRFSYDTYTTVAGKVVINGNVTMTYNSDGTVTVAIAGQAPTTYDNVSSLDYVCAL